MSHWFAAGCVAAVMASVGVVANAATAQGMPTGGPKHIFYIMEENQSFNEIIGNKTDAPFINQLASQYNLATNFHGVTHPSLPNYLAAISGDFQGIWDDCAAGAAVTCPPEEFVPGSGDGTDGNYLTPAQIASASSTPHMFGGQNLVDQLESHGLSWKAYMENLPSPGSTVEYAPVINGTTVKLYAQKHDPFMYFSDITTNPARMQKIVPFEANFGQDLKSGKVPNFSFISPNQCHDMHGISAATAALINLPACATTDGAIQLGDQWLKQTVNEIMSSSVWQNGNAEIIIPWDENDYSTDLSGGPGSPVGVGGQVLGGGHAPLLVLTSEESGPITNNTLLDHYTTLKAIEQLWHLGCLANTCDINNTAQFMNLFNASQNQQ
jgi:phospholipase C